MMNMNNEDQNTLHSTIAEDLDISISNEESISEEELLDAITARVSTMLDKNPELLFSYMYRLDVLEEKIQFALKHQKNVPADMALAQLILDRQKQRILSKQKYKSDPIKGWGLD